jgi:putative hydrolase of the HAD superfamily
MIEALFLNVGGVLGTNGWGNAGRQKACEEFGLDRAEFEERHRLLCDAYELGKLTLDQYLDHTVFYQQREFSRQQFSQFLYAQSQPYPEMLEFITALKKKYDLKVFVLSNEGREVSNHSIEVFGLRRFVDGFCVSSFVRFRKPDPDLFGLALAMSMRPASRTLYVDDQELFVEVAQGYGMKGCLHDSTQIADTIHVFKQHGLIL